MRPATLTSCLLTLAAITALGLFPDIARSAADKKHETVKGHGVEEPSGIGYWKEITHWTSKPGGVISVPDDLNTQTNWTFDTPADLTSNMFHYVLMDDLMNTVSDYTQDDLTLVETSFQVSEPGSPPTLTLTLQQDHYVGNGWEILRASPIDVSMTRTRYEATAVAGEYLAIYDGMVPVGEHWQVLDPAMGPNYVDLYSDQPQPVQIAVLTANVPEPSSLVLLAGCGLALAFFARRRSRALRPAALVLAAVMAVGLLGTSAEAKPKTVHWTDKDHLPNSWWEFKNWREVPNDLLLDLVPLVPNTVGWDNFGPGTPEMVHYTLMDDMMNTVSEFDQTALTSVTMSFIYSSDGAPPTMDFSVLDEQYITSTGIERHLVNPLQMTMDRVRIDPGTTPGTMLATYQATVPAGQQWSTTDPALGPSPVISTTDAPYVYELVVEAPVPEPTGFALALGVAGLWTVTTRRQRKRT